MTEHSWTIKPKRVLLILMGIAIFLNVMSLIVWYVPRRFQIDIGRMFELFFVDNENNVPTFFAVLLFIMCGLLLIYIGLITRFKNERFSKLWTILAIGFFYLACDDFMVLHEKLTKPTNVLFRYLKISNDIQFSWVIPVVAILILVGIFFIPFFIHLPHRTKILFIVAGAIFLTGAIGMETLGGSIRSVFGPYSREYMIETSFEEFLEMAGPIVFLYSLLDYLSRKAAILKISIQSNLPEISN